jgi:hypothetical protein
MRVRAHRDPNPLPHFFRGAAGRAAACAGCRITGAGRLTAGIGRGAGRLTAAGAAARASAGAGRLIAAADAAGELTRGRAGAGAATLGVDGFVALGGGEDLGAAGSVADFGIGASVAGFGAGGKLGDSLGRSNFGPGVPVVAFGSRRGVGRRSGFGLGSTLAPTGGFVIPFAPGSTDGTLVPGKLPVGRGSTLPMAAGFGPDGSTAGFGSIPFAAGPVRLTVGRCGTSRFSDLGAVCVPGLAVEASCVSAVARLSAISRTPRAVCACA